MEKNYDQLQNALKQLPTYQMPDKNWDIVEHSLDIDVRSLPHTKIPRDIWTEIEASLNEQQFSLPEIKIPIDIWDTIENELDKAETQKIFTIVDTKKEKKSFLFVFKSIGVAASILLLFGIGKLFFSSNEQIEMLAYDGAKLKSMQLQDGSIIYNKNNAKINYPKTFAKNSREIIQTEGIAFFEITKNAERPFIIHSELGTVRVLGTSFTTNVSKDSIEVIVKTGKVSVTTETDSATLLPTESIVYYADGRKPKMMDAATKLILETSNAASNDKKITVGYNQEPLSKVFANIEKKYSVTIIYNAKQIAPIKITGKFVDSNADFLLQAICEATNVTFSKTNNTYTIY
jgi:transmembrane sensor